MTEYLIGIDIGTYASKGVLTTSRGRILATSLREHEVSIPRAGWAEHDAEDDWWADFRFICSELLEKSSVDPARILALGCSTIGPCCLPVDAQGVPLRKAILYGIDIRASPQIEWLNRELGKETIFNLCGNDLSAQAVGPKILWLRENEPQVFDKAEKFVSGTSYLVWRLTGKWVIDHYSASTFLPLYSIRDREWDQSASIEIIPPHRLPQICWTTEIAGRVERKASKETGLPEGLPVIVGTIDAAAEAVSVGVVSPGRLMLMYGSTAFLILVTSQSLSDPRIWSAPFLFPDSFALMGGMATTGTLTRWFRDQLARELTRTSREDDRNPFQVLAEDAARIEPGSEGVVVLPYFSGERTPLNDPSARGAFFGLTLSHTREHLYRAVLESVGYGIRHHIEVFRELDAEIDSIHAVGGGAQNKLWLQIVTDICRVQQHVAEVSIGASYGDALLAGLGVGAFESLPALEGVIRRIHSVTPEPSNSLPYDRAYRNYRALYRNTRHLMGQSPPDC